MKYVTANFISQPKKAMVNTGRPFWPFLSQEESSGEETEGTTVKCGSRCHCSSVAIDSLASFVREMTKPPSDSEHGNVQGK